MNGQNIRIRLRHSIIESSILDEGDRLDGEADRSPGAGPHSAADEIEKFCVNRSPHVDKKSREQFEIRTIKGFSTSSIRRPDG
jgi:small subunit ribosomal protein S10